MFLADVPTQVSVTDLPFEFPGGNRRSESGLYVKELAYVVS